MQYDPDLLKKLLLIIEAQASPRDYLSIDQINLPNYSRDQIGDHLILLKEANCIVAAAQYADDQLFEFLISRPTLEGYKLIEAAKNDTLWKKLVNHSSRGLGFIVREGFILGLGALLQNAL